MEIEYGQMRIGVNEKYAEELLVETRVDTAERGGAEKVLSLEAEAKAVGAELLDGEAEVSGKVNYRLLYLDRQGRLCGLDYFKDFKCRVKGAKIAPNGRCALDFSLPEAEARIDGDGIELSAMLDISLRYFGEEERRTVTAVTEAESLRKEFVTRTGKRSERILDLEKVADVGPGVKKIVLFGVDAVPTRIAKDESGTELSGEVRANVLYLNEADEVVELTTTIPFAEIFDAGDCEYGVTVKNSRIVLTDDEEGNAVEVEVALAVEEIRYEEHAQSVLTALCGETHRIAEELEECRCRRFVGQSLWEETLAGEIPLGEGAGYIAFVRPGCHAIAGVSVSDGQVKVEGVAAIRVVYLTDEGYGCSQGELPFAFTLPFAEAKSGLEAEVSLRLTSFKAVSNGENASVTAKIDIAVSLYEEEVCRYLSDAAEGDPIPESEAGISVYFAEKGEDVWQIAKAMGVLPSALVKANPFLEEPIVENKKVLIFRNK